MSDPSQLSDTPDGFVCVSPWAYMDKTLVIDMNVFLAGTRTTRNILSTRNSVRSKSNTHQEAGYILPKVATGQAPSEFVYTYQPGNLATVFDSNRPVRVKMRNANGELDMGLLTLFVLTSPCIELTITNEQNEGNAEINLIAI